MGTSENNRTQSILAQKNPQFSVHDYNGIRSMPLLPLQPHLQRENVLVNNSVPSSLKRKRAQSPSLTSPTPFHTPTTDNTPLLSSSTSAPNQAVSVTTRNVSAITPISIRHAPPHQDDLFGNRSKIRVAAVHPVSQHAPGEGPHDVPPITFLREQNASVSPVLSARVVAAHPGGRAGAGYTKAASSNAVKSVPHVSRVSLNPSKNAGHVPSSNALPQQIQGPVLASSVFTPISAAPDLSQLDRDKRSANPRTRAVTGASAHNPAPRYTHDSLIRRHPAPRAPGDQYPNANYEYAGQHELEAVWKTNEAHVGMLSDPPALGVEGVAAMVKTLRDQSEGEQPEAQWWVAPRTNTAPTAAYATLLEETFGPGSILRGEGLKPAELGRRRAGGGSREKSRSPSTGRSASSTADLDAGMDVVTDEANMGAEVGRRARAWIAQIQVLVKGKTPLGREDLKSLADTMREIANMEAKEGRALGDDLEPLRKSIWQLAQLEDIPYRDEYKVRSWARRLLKHWPAL